ncbi:hypothetical protein EDC96DRAFT_449604 [Choanephora cucurbitarum]|nr:hypothetical protein EDC96DRAFT_449604 [Choanephora cucurbitarum]
MISITHTINGQIRHRRKLTKLIFFVDIQDSTGLKSQVFFRKDDNSLDDQQFQEAFRSCKPGQTVEIQVGLPLDPSERVGKSFPVWQSDCPVQVIEPYTARQAFIQDRALGSTDILTDIRLTDGTRKHKSQLVCKYWINKNKCIQGDNCLFQHPTGDAFDTSRSLWLDQKFQSRKEINHDPNDPHKDKKPHSVRAIVFADWIQKTFGNLIGQGIVLDVAGGKGELAMFLSRGFGIPSVVVEPNERNRPSYWYTRLRRLLYRFEIGDLDQPDWKRKDIQIDMNQWPYSTTPDYLHTFLDSQFLSEHTELLSKVSLFVGLHADQATVPIVEAALEAGKAFAVVPCCVFSHENRERRLQSGQLVTTTEQQIQYICELKEPGEIKTAYLDFEGKNVVVYWLPSQ